MKTLIHLLLSLFLNSETFPSPMELLSKYEAQLRCIVILLREGFPGQPDHISPSTWQASSSTFSSQDSHHPPTFTIDSCQTTNTCCFVFSFVFFQILFCEEASPLKCPFPRPHLCLTKSYPSLSNLKMSPTSEIFSSCSK